MTSALAQTPPGDPVQDLRLARVHLRMGQLLLARAELEDLLGRDTLDTTGIAVLAEARWRTGEAEEAAAAATAHLEAGGRDPIAICIAAEAAAADGRPDDARALMDRLPSTDAATLDALFAGMPRRAFWPAAPVDRGEAEDIRRETTARGGPGLRGGTTAREHRAEAETQAYPGGDGTAGSERAGTSPLSAAPASPGRSVPGPREVLEAAGAWGDIAAQVAGGLGGPARATRPSPPSGRRTRHAPEPNAELERAREELGTKPERALLRLALVLRHDPTLAPAVLDVIHLRHEPAAVLLRGDAERLLGRHLEAEAAFEAVADSLER